MEAIVIPKLDAARRQLEMAVELFFEKRDPVAIHTLCCAAYDIIDGVCQDRGGIEVFCKRRYTTKPGALRRADINAPQNFFKHADDDPKSSLEFYPEMTEPLMADACRTFMELTGESVTPFICFVWWFKCRDGEDGFECSAEHKGLLKDLLVLFARDDRAAFLARLAEGGNHAMVD
jgi:hypothetical protein